MTWKSLAARGKGSSVTAQIQIGRSCSGGKSTVGEQRNVLFWNGGIRQNTIPSEKRDNVETFALASGHHFKAFRCEADLTDQMSDPIALPMIGIISKDKDDHGGNNEGAEKNPTPWRTA